MQHFLVRFAVVSTLLCLTGCEDTDLKRAAEAGVDAYKAVTLSDDAVAVLSQQSAGYMDRQHPIAEPDSIYAKRLQRLVANLHELNGNSFNYRVYLQDLVNAFALADGTTRLNSGLMDMLDDGERRLVIGHIMEQHVRNKLRFAFAASAVRQGFASRSGVVGNFARSQFGGW